MTIVLDQTCAPLRERLGALAPVFEFTRATGVLTAPRSAVTELYRALRHQQVPGPYLLVAASFAGFTALLFAELYPRETAGLVLVDPSHPRQSPATLAALPDLENSTPELEEFRRFLRGPGTAWETGCRQLSRLGPLGDVPLIVLAAGAPAVPASLPRLNRDRLVETWHALQRDHAQRSTRGELRIVPGCGHALVAEAPEAVITAVADLIRKAEGTLAP